MKEARFRKMIEFIDSVAMDIDDYTDELDDYLDKLQDVRYCIIEEFIYGEPCGDVSNTLRELIQAMNSALGEAQDDYLMDIIDNLMALAAMYEQGDTINIDGELWTYRRVE